MNARAVAVVIDPIQSVKGKVVIDAFRLMNPRLAMMGQEPRQTTSNLGHLHRPSIQAKLESAVKSQSGERAYIRAILSEDGKSVKALPSQDEQSTLSDANAFIAVGENENELAAGSTVTVVVLERRYI